MKKYHISIFVLASSLWFPWSICAAPPADTVTSEPLRVVAKALFKNQAVVVINGKRRTLKTGKRSPEGVLLVRSNSEVATVEINGEELSLRLDGNIIGNFSAGPKRKSLVLYPDQGGHYVVDGTINGTSTRFLLDTGATSVSINSREAKRIGLLYKVDGKPTVVETAAGVVPAYRVTFKEVKIRDLSVKQVSGIVISGDFPRSALLGQSFLNRLNMRREGQALELTER